MKKWIIVLVVSMLAVSAMAQLAGLPIAGGAAAPGAGLLRASGGVVLGDDFNLYGGRLTFAPIQALALFGDAGAIDPDGADMGWAVQGGGLFTLPLGLPVDVALRGALGVAKFDLDAGGDITTMTVNGGVLVSKTFDMFTPYGFLGVNYADTEADVPGLAKVTDDETDLAVAGGVNIALNDQLSLYAEIAHIDDTFFGFGAGFTF